MTGVTFRCCAIWRQLDPTVPCPACQASIAYWRTHRCSGPTCPRKTPWVDGRRIDRHRKPNPEGANP